MKNNKFIYLILVILIFWLVFLTIGQRSIETKNTTEVVNQYNISGFSTDFTKIIEEDKSSIVTINADGKISSGFVYKQVEDKSYVICSYHGVSDAFNINVIFSNSYSVHATLLGKNDYADVAVLEISTPYLLQELSLADSTLLKQGEFVISIGTPYSLEYVESVELGMVSGNRMIENSITVENQTINYYIDAIQLSSNIAPGYSGSPLINMNGNVVGMNTMSMNNNINFAVTSNEIQIIADKIIAGENANKYQLGIKGTYIANMPAYLKTNLNLNVDTINGLYVEKVKDGSVANVAGIRPGDIILSINGKPLNNMNDYLDVAYTYTEAFEFEIFKDNSTLKYTVNIGD